ncbi:phosphopentomutase [Allorhizobium undicola]|uniref:phosphopentomutase n=1 Tax=Allorhizobium undicola TaxID=78527 RepID=UPI0004826611|nr:phosphopentomutase [Allorhizobium undicola]
MARAFLFVLDSFGVGGAPDAAIYGDEGADTLGHIAEFCAAGAADRPGLRQGPLNLPNMSALGLLEIARMANGAYPAGMPLPQKLFGLYGTATEKSRGKDTPSGHWEIAGVPVSFDWGYFPREGEAFPAQLIETMLARTGLPGILGNCHASGTEIIDRLGEDHIRTGKPICYTSSDSVFQVAAHETHFGLGRLYALCEILRELLDPLNIGRVIARPFTGERPGGFQRTGNRRDYAVPPPEPTLLDRLKSAGRGIHAVGKIGDIFAHQGTTRELKASGNAALMATTLAAMADVAEGDLLFTNFVDFDMEYGHRRDVAGYAAALERFDMFLPDVYRRLAPDDLVILTADHGCDPTWRGTDHTRERVPVMAFGPSIGSRTIGIRETFADIGETIAAHLGIEPGRHGRSFL